MDNKSKFYDEIDVVEMGEFEKKRAEKIIEMIKDLHISNFIDLGCLPPMTEYFAEKLDCKGIGVNISKKVIKSFKDKNGKVKYIVADVEQLNLRKKFDLVICGELIEHVFDVDKFVEKIKDMMHENSYLLLTTPNLASLFNRISLLLGWQPRGINPSRKILLNPLTKYDYNWGHVSMFTYAALKKFLEAYGFKILKVKGMSGGHEGENKLRSVIRYLMSILPSFAENILILAKLS
jgi:SAM-dependent methyltransferase